MKKPVLGITIGDPAGIGPEIVLKSALTYKIRVLCNPVIFGDIKILELLTQKLEIVAKFNPIKKIDEALFEPRIIDVIDFCNIDLDKFKPGTIDPMNGEAAYQYLKTACLMALDGNIDAMVTAPISKEAIWKAGYQYEGQTQILGELCKADPIRMLLINQGLKVVLHSRHKPIKEALNDINAASLIETIILVHKSFEKMGLINPKIAIAGLNPHAGEAGIFGDEEELEIKPAIFEARSLLIDAYGPFPADTIFMRTINRDFDVAIALYHDQGMIPIKIKGFTDPITYILGLPIIRTSVGHGTAFDIAWKNLANPGSMQRAIEFASKVASNSKKKE
jgi:4-phospho-D-threonate 3-dehydrogenase / 4-phospho-D-erythronate 3-dehydrogenase